ncbi:dihydrolipoyl dehydrogenase family protein [Halococcoides cellulosivorans]|uniref:NAD(P)/FAD-dependent oxidoreductase n=1 Tax=Halococcoides cellulosivorans TaxID=1679096 RepID=A0A2R4WYI8_9EURY|nr:NAD(P)/FAD-dependent oxidoreductase [Halococcoides cellulosivorans]AWB26591.1 NAD(P)/FAD-dependent oxidoreductase [Halococcoides cellulosivorans]
MTDHVAVIGAYGSAGSDVASELADEDVELTLIDDGDPGGGLCILRGCMPSKEVISAAEHRFAARHDDRLGGPVPEIDLERVVERKDEHTLSWAGHRRDAVDALADRENVTLLRESARFVDDRILEVGDRQIDPDYVVIATGSVVNVPPIDGIDRIDPKTSADVLDATDLPDSVLALGLGYIGLELVPYLHEAGVDVTAVEMLPDLLPRADDPFGTDLHDYYRSAYDIDIHMDATVESVAPDGDGVIANLADGSTLDADDLYLFTGRRPAVDRLNLDATAIDPGEGWVASTMQTAADERVFVAGDADGRRPLLHVAKEEAAVVAENVRRHTAGRPLREHDSITHEVMFSGLGVMPYARVGHTAASANEAGHEFVVVDREASDDGVFKAKAVPDGRARLVAATDGTVLGWQGLHYHADVMAKTMQIVVETGLDVREIPDRAYHPTTPELLDGLISDAVDRID